jgi:hypothetical protein
MEQLWELLHGQLTQCMNLIHSHNLATVLGVLLIAVHSLPLHYRPEQSLNPFSQRPLTKQAGKACHILPDKTDDILDDTRNAEVP